MKLLDDSLIKEISLSTRCQAKFKQYRVGILIKVLYHIGVAFIFILGLLTFIKGGITFFADGSLGILASLFLFLMAFMLKIARPTSITMLINGIKDIQSNDLKIEVDVFLGIQANEKREYDVELQDLGKLSFDSERFPTVAKNKKVYVVQTAASKTLLDLIPVEEF